MDTIFLHDEQRRITKNELLTAMVKCRDCGNVQRKYVESWYSGGFPCALKSKFCRECGSDRLGLIRK